MVDSDSAGEIQSRDRQSHGESQTRCCFSENMGGQSKENERGDVSIVDRVTAKVLKTRLDLFFPVPDRFFCQ